MRSMPNPMFQRDGLRALLWLGAIALMVVAGAALTPAADAHEQDGGASAAPMSISPRVAIVSPTPAPAPAQGTPHAESGAIFSAISASNRHTCGLRADGTIVCWGGNQGWDYDGSKYFEELGQAVAPAGQFSAVSAGRWHSCGLRTDGTITCWGDNSIGQSSAPSGQFVAVSAGGHFTCALRPNGKIVCWGRNHKGQLDAPTGRFTSVSSSWHHSCGLRTDGTITCWGDNRHSKTDSPSGRFTAVAAGPLHSCAVRVDGTAVCWGHNGFGQAEPPTDPASKFSAIAAEFSHSCGLRTDGTIACWGENDDGELDAPANQFNAVSIGADHSCGLRVNGSVICWGANYYGQTDAPVAVQAGVSTTTNSRGDDNSDETKLQPTQPAKPAVPTTTNSRGDDNSDETELQPTQPAKPAAPTGLTATAGEQQVTLSWSDPGNPSITQYKYRMRVGNKKWGKWAAIANSDATTTTHTVTSLEGGTRHRFQLRAKSGVTRGKKSSVEATPTAPQPEVVKTPTPKEMVPPSDVTVRCSTDGSTITVSWTPDPTGVTEAYHIMDWGDSDLSHRIVDPTASSFTFNASPGVTYWLAVIGYSRTSGKYSSYASQDGTTTCN